MSKEQLIKEIEKEITIMPEFAIEEVYHFLLFLKQRIQQRIANEEEVKMRSQKSQNSILDMVDEITQEIPREEWKKLPKDFSRNLDHYLYGAPKIEE
ncbi:hypothetical protein [Spirulina sp. 06S082]|uniref:hypothetical protein n=1 Tax=Spirulina sp. 06S082 TaxID=3110248 RepID=UPI002B1F17F0|nr:hypothetical protein [Spirulina sp. 06S082]MEA5468531.1 hypothetical protein [Spirulina sp. 06S082]